MRARWRHTFRQIPLPFFRQYRKPFFSHQCRNIAAGLFDVAVIRAIFLSPCPFYPVDSLGAVLVAPLAKRYGVEVVALSSAVAVVEAMMRIARADAAHNARKPLNRAHVVQGGAAFWPFVFGGALLALRA